MKTEGNSISDSCHIFEQLMRSQVQVQVERVYEPVTGCKEAAAVETETENRRVASTAQKQ